MQTKNYQHQSFLEFILFLKKLCINKKNGMLFIITNTRQSAHILLINGDISEISFGRKKGEEALLLLKKVKTCRFHFSDGLKKANKNFCIVRCTNEEIFRKLTNTPLQKKLKVLVVDDSGLVRGEIVRSLSDQFEIYEAINGYEAISKLSRIKPDLILLDLIMPEMDGYQTLEIIKRNDEYAKIPVLLLTSRNSLLDKIKGKMSKSDAYITKPFKDEKLLKDVKFHLSLHHKNSSESDSL